MNTLLKASLLQKQHHIRQGRQLECAAEECFLSPSLAVFDLIFFNSVPKSIDITAFVV